MINKSWLVSALDEVLTASYGIDRSYISGIEGGVCNSIVKVLARIAKPLDVDGFVLLVPPSSSVENRNAKTPHSKSNLLCLSCA